jgi:hypothetical protein
VQKQEPANTRLAGADTLATLEHPISTQKSIDPTLPPSNTSTLNSSSKSNHEPTQTQSSNTAIAEELKDAQQEAEESDNEGYPNNRRRKRCSRPLPMSCVCISEAAKRSIVWLRADQPLASPEAFVLRHGLASLAEMTNLRERAR